MRFWIGLAVLANSWQLGLTYFEPASWPAWAAAVVLGAALLAGSPLRLPAFRDTVVALALVVPAAIFLPGPTRAAPLLMAAGLAINLLSVAGRWRTSLARGAITAGIAILAQSLVLELYAAITSRGHDLPVPLTTLIGSAARLLGADVAGQGSSLAFHSAREVHQFGATWEALFDPSSIAFLSSGFVLLAILALAIPEGQRGREFLRNSGRFALAVLLWLAFRAGLMVALLVHRGLRADSSERLNLMSQYFSPWLALGMLAVPVLLVWWFVRLPGTDGGQDADASPSDIPPVGAKWHRAAALGLLAASLFLAALTVLWSPAGKRLEGRVMVVERHSTWEPSDRAYDTNSFGEKPSYSYTSIYNYCGQFFRMSRLLEADPISDEKLDECDVLMIKTPTARYTQAEVDAVARFVERGGGLLLIGEHTDRKIQGPFINDVAARFDFKFRYDTLFWIGDPFVQPYRPARASHPAVQHVPPMWFAVSCSIDPGWSWGAAVIREAGLWSVPADYHIGNFFAEPEYRADSRFGPFVQLWATTRGRGRVMAFTDSTIFSNFSTFEPGKPELMLGMLEWLNRRSLLDRIWARFALAIVLVGVILAAAFGGFLLARRRRVPWLLLLSAALLGWAVGSEAVAQWNRWTMPLPQMLPETQRMPEVVLDRTVSEVPLSLRGFAQQNGQGFALLEQWIPRMGYSTRRASGDAAFRGDAIVVVCPTRSVSDEFREGLKQYVAAGGKLLVIDSPSSRGTTANGLLWPFGISVSHAGSTGGVLALADGWPAMTVDGACRIAGGTPFMWVDGMPAAARARYGDGEVIAVGFGTALNDSALGLTWMREAEPEMLQRSDLLFSLIRGLMTGDPVVAEARE